MPSTVPEDWQHVVAAVISDRNDRVLLARRPAHLHQGGKWEFPGGKVESGESALDALRRELYEELGITVEHATPLLQVRHRYPDKRIWLDVWHVHAWSGVATGREGQQLGRYALNELAKLPFPDANDAILRALSLPAVYGISCATELGEAEFLRRFEHALSAGLRLLQIREPEWAESRLHSLVTRALALAAPYGARILVNTEVGLAQQWGAHGVHLNSRRMTAFKRRPVAATTLLATSCHNEAELEQAARIGADFVVLSPVLDTPSHPGTSTLGWTGFGDLMSAAKCPVYALGGLSAEHVGLARHHGAIGVALISGLWREDPGGGDSPRYPILRG